MSSLAGLLRVFALVLKSVSFHLGRVLCWLANACETQRDIADAEPQAPILLNVFGLPRPTR
jgi:hypothetical protein